MTFSEFVPKRKGSKTEEGPMICTFSIVRKFLNANICDNEYIGFEVLTACAIHNTVGM
jgi:hypothetical protein